MFSDQLMPIQSMGLPGSSLLVRPVRRLIIVGIALGIALAARSVSHSTDTERSYLTPNTTETIVLLCREGRPDDAIRLADRELNAIEMEHSTYRSLIAGHLHFLKGGALRVAGEEVEARAEYRRAALLMQPALSQQSIEIMMAEGGASSPRLAAWAVLHSGDSGPLSVNNASWELSMFPGGDPASAAQAMEPMVRYSTNPDFIDTYAWSLYLAGHGASAVREESRALDYGMEEGPILQAYYRACLFGMEGRPHAASRQLRWIFQQDIRFTSAWDAADRFDSISDGG